MSERVRTTKKRARKQARDESFEAGVEAMYHRSKGHLVALAKAESKGTPEWQKNVALATNTAGAAAGPAAIYMAVRQARSKQGGMPRAGVEAVEAKSKPTTRLGRAARATGKVVRNPKAIAAGGAVAIGAQVANTTGDVIAARFLAEDKKKSKSTVNKATDTRDPKSYKKAINYVTPEQGESYKAGVHRLANKKGNRTAAVGGAAGAVAGSGTAAYLLRIGPKKVVVPTAIAAGGLLGVQAGAAGRKSARNSVYDSRRFEGKRLDGKPVRKAMPNVNKRMSAEEKATLIAGGTLGGVLGGAAGAFGGNQLDRLGVRAGMKAGGLDFVDEKGKPNLAMVNRKGVYQLRSHNRGKKLKGAMKRNRFALGGAALGGLAGAMSGMGEAREDNYMMRKSIEQSLISKSDAVVVTGNGNSLVEKRNFNAEADRQRRLGLYAGAGLGAGAVLGDAARRRMPRVEEELKDGRKIKRFDMPKGRKGRLTLAALAGGAALGAGGGASAYRRGISERNNTYL